jgi:hypothetical protein
MKKVLITGATARLGQDVGGTASLDVFAGKSAVAVEFFPAAFGRAIQSNDTVVFGKRLAPVMCVEKN